MESVSHYIKRVKKDRFIALKDDILLTEKLVLKGLKENILNRKFIKIYFSLLKQDIKLFEEWRKKKGILSS